MLKLNWQAVCKPRDEGGLVFRMLEEWNKAAMVKHIWAFCKKEDTLWVKWIHTDVIKDACFWTMKVPQHATWIVRKLLQLRSVVQPWITFVVGIVMIHSCGGITGTPLILRI